MALASGDPIEHGRRVTAGILAKIPPAQRSRRSSIAAHGQWAQEPARTARTAPGRQGLFDRFQREVDAKFPDVDPATRAKMATNAYRAYFKKMAYDREKARREARSGGAS